jgi:glutathione S-transferase
MKLYYSPRTRAGRVRWLLEELKEAGAPVEYELERVDMKAGAHKTADYKMIHPHGSVPAFVDGDVTIYESAAIVLYLADKFIGAGLAPPFGSKSRGLYYQWAFYGMATVEQHIIAANVALSHLGEADKPAAMIEERKKFETIAQVIGRAVGENGYLLGEHFSACDVVCGGAVIWGNFQGYFEGHERVKSYAKRLADRPASRRARAD